VTIGPGNRPLHVIVVANYTNDSQQSMQRFAALLRDGLTERGITVTFVAPTSRLAGDRRTHAGVDKWLGYADKFVLFPPKLRQMAKQTMGPAVVHICDHSNAMYVPWIADIPHVVTCHDLLAVRSAQGEFSETRTRWSGKVLQRRIVHGLRQARRIVCDSEATRADVLRLVIDDPARVHVVYPAVAPVFTGARRVSDSRPFILHVGGNQWYKNRRGVIEIYRCLVEQAPWVPSLVLAGQPLPPDLRALVETQGLSGRVVERPNVSDTELQNLYSGAALLLFPSLAEGFGWPVLEAMANGCRVVASRRSSLPEVGGTAITYIDPSNPSDAANTVRHVLEESTETSNGLVTAGQRQAETFSLDRMIGQYLSIYASEVGSTGERSLLRV
jgi:glycosyltransferase involved in cell wall biosynthesis